MTCSVCIWAIDSLPDSCIGVESRGSRVHEAVAVTGTSAVYAHRATLMLYVIPVRPAHRSSIRNNAYYLKESWVTWGCYKT